MVRLMGALRRSARLRIDRSRGADAEYGFTLVEVVVAMVIFAVMLPSTLGVLVKTTQGVQENRARVVAASLASTQIERVRGATAFPSDLTLAPVKIGNVNYTTTQTVSLRTASGGSVTCNNLSSVVLNAVVTVEVDWDKRRPEISKARAETLLRATAAGTGAISVNVTGSSGQFVTGVPVTLSNGSTRLTDDTGCALFAGLPITVSGAPTYTATLDSAGYVGKVSGVQRETSPITTVKVNEVTPIVMTYDKSMSLNVAYGNAVGGPISAADLDRIPSEFRTGRAISSTKTASLNLPGSVTGLYPAAYTVRGASGSAANCTLASQDMSAGLPSTQTVTIPTARVGITNLTTFAAIGDIVAIYEGPTTGSGAISCPIGTQVKIGTVFSVFGEHSAQLPLGQWRLQFPWNPIGFIPIPGLTVICSDISLSVSNIGQLLVDVGNLIGAVVGGFLTGGGCN